MSLFSNPIVIHKYYTYDANAQLIYLFQFSDDTFLFVADSDNKDMTDYDSICHIVGIPYSRNTTQWGGPPIYSSWQIDRIDKALTNQLIPYWSNPNYIGYNGIDKTNQEPKNNDGLEYCFWCQTKTKQSFGFNYKTIYNVCPKCNK